MVDIVLDFLAASLHRALEQVRTQTRASEESAHRLRAVVNAVHAVGQGSLLQVLHAEVERLAALKEATAHAKAKLAGAHAEVRELDDCAQRLAHGFETLGHAELRAVEGSGAFAPELDEIDHRVADWAGELERMVAHELDPLTNAAEAAAHLVDALAHDTAGVAGAMEQNLAAWTQTFEHDWNAVLHQGWDKLTGDLRSGFAAADAHTADIFDRSGTTVQDGILGAAGTTSGKVADSVGRVDELLHKVNDAIAAANALESALRAASLAF